MGMFCLNKNPSINVPNGTGLSQIVSHHKRVLFFRLILSFHQPKNLKDYIDLRCSSTLFYTFYQKPPLWTTYPTPNHATLQSLVNRIEVLRGDEESSCNVPSFLFIEEGDHIEEGKYVKIKKPITIIGAGRENTTLVGVGLKIKGNQSEGVVEIHDLKIKGGEDGLNMSYGMNVIMSGCTIEKCRGYSGVYASSVDIVCEDLQVIGCQCVGLFGSSGSTITLCGNGTSIQGNGAKWGSDDDYGVSSSPSSTINLVHPLTKKQVSTDNHGGRNWDVRGKCGTINQVDNDGVVLQILYEGGGSDHDYDYYRHHMCEEREWLNDDDY